MTQPKPAVRIVSRDEEPDEQQPDPEQERAELLGEQEALAAREGGLLDALLAAAEEKEQTTAQINIKRRGKLYFSFEVLPLSETQQRELARQATSYVKVAGVRQPEETDMAELRSLVIYRATVEDQTDGRGRACRLWDLVARSPQAQAKGIKNGVEAVDFVLLPGEKDRAYKTVMKVNGYNDDDEEEQEALAGK